VYAILQLKYLGIFHGVVNESATFTRKVMNPTFLRSAFTEQIYFLNLGIPVQCSVLHMLKSGFLKPDVLCYFIIDRYFDQNWICSVTEKQIARTVISSNELYVDKL
jgi:hypothetical protein